MRLEPLTKKAIQAIGEGKTINEYLDSHNDQNDLFENIALIDEVSHVKARFSMLDQDAIKRDSKWPQKAKKQKNLIRKQLLNRRPDAFKNGKKYWVYRVIQSNNGMVDYPGICSFTSSYDNCYMWSHYASSNKGICIGFSGFKYESSKEQGKSTTKILSHDPPIILSEVNYLPLLIIEQSNTKGLWEQFNIENPRTHLLYGQFIDHAVICHKNPVYEHEKEWRLISSRPTY